MSLSTAANGSRSRPRDARSTRTTLEARAGRGRRRRPPSASFGADPRGDPTRERRRQVHPDDSRRPLGRHLGPRADGIPGPEPVPRAHHPEAVLISFSFSGPRGVPELSPPARRKSAVLRDPIVAPTARPDRLAFSWLCSLLLCSPPLAEIGRATRSPGRMKICNRAHARLLS